MNCVIRCISEDKIYCPCCGSKRVVARNTNVSHCGQCGTHITIEYVEKIQIVEEQEEFVQLSLFEM